MPHVVLQKRNYDNLNGVLILLNYLTKFTSCLDQHRFTEFCFSRLLLLLNLGSLGTDLGTRLMNSLKNLYGEVGESLISSSRILLDNIDSSSFCISFNYSLSAYDVFYNELIGNNTEPTKVLHQTQQKIKRRRLSVSTPGTAERKQDNSEIIVPVTLLEKIKQLDNASLIILLMAYVGTNEQQWLLSQESLFFLIKLCIYSEGFINHSLLLTVAKEYNLIVQLVRNEEAVSLRLAEGSYYKINFSDSVSGILNQSYLSEGLVYFNTALLPLLLYTHYVNTLETVANNILILNNKVTLLKSIDPIVDSLLTRIQLIQPSLCTSAVDKTANLEFEPLSIKILQTESAKIPPCMHRALKELYTHHHLPHNARLQLWPFLKDCGMRLEESILLNRESWRNAAEFSKEHIYTMRHIYGLEGRRRKRTSYTCSRIISNLSGPPLPSCFGCPFYNSSKTEKEEALKFYKLKQTDIEDIITSHSDNDPEQSCVLLYNKLHPSQNSIFTGQSPVTFYKSCSKQ